MKCQTDSCALNVTAKEQRAVEVVVAAANARSQGFLSVPVNSAMEADANVVIFAEAVAKSNRK